MLTQLKKWAKLMRRDLLVLYLAGRDPRVPWYCKIMALATAAYAFSPIDLIPDFIPVVGYLDDIIILPVAIALTLKLIPNDLIVDLRQKADLRQIDTRQSGIVGSICIIIVWLVMAILLIRLLFIR